MLVPSRESFLKAASTRRIPVYADIRADLITPVAAYWMLAHDEPISFLLESVTGGEQVARYSLLGVRPLSVLRSRGRSVRRDGMPEPDLQEGEDPLHRLQTEIEMLSAEPAEGLPRFYGGAVGVLSYDFVRFLERLPDTCLDELALDDMAMMLVETTVVFDHARNTVRVVVLAEPSESGYDKAEQEIERIRKRLQAPVPPLPEGVFPVHRHAANMTQESFESAVRRVLEYIHAGDGIQMVLSQRFSKPSEAHPLTIYRALRSLNPSPYMFLMRFGDFDLVGASPELLVSHHGDTAKVRPIAGTRPRGEDEATDAALAEGLLADEKERAEHIMLVDLGRNDLGRIAEIGTVSVDQLMVIERYSHVMHIVSEVSARRRKDLTAFDVIRASFPAGTLSGAPKVRAMQIIDELEVSRRGIYGGAVGTIGPAGDLDLAIAIRTIVLKDGVAHVQAGAGIVGDSDPTKEWEETVNKASAALRALDLAQQGLS